MVSRLEDENKQLQDVNRITLSAKESLEKDVEAQASEVGLVSLFLSVIDVVRLGFRCCHFEHLVS